MTSLSVIMDMNDDDQDARAIKKDGASSQGGRRYGAAHSSSTNSARLGSAVDQQQQSSAATSSLGGKKRSSSKKLLLSSPSATAPPPPSPGSYTGPVPPTASSSAADHMDHHTYGHSGPSAAAAMRMRSVGGNNGRGDAEVPVKLTPITGRVSRAKKGMPVHVCETCKPPKTFTRAEHLRRHQLSHEKPQYACQYPGCEKSFHRPDLLQRHQQRHETEGDRASTTTASRRASQSSSTGQPAATSPYPNNYQAGTTKSPSSRPVSPPAQSPGFPSVLQPPVTYPQSQGHYAPATMPGYSPGMYTPNGNVAAAVTEAPYQTVPTTGVLAPPPIRQNPTWPVASQPVYQSAMYQSAPQYGYPEQISYPYGTGLGPDTGMGEGYDFQGMASPIVLSSPPVSSSSANSVLAGYPNTQRQSLSSPSPNRLAPEANFGQWSISSTPSMSSATLSVGTLPLTQRDMFPAVMDLDMEGVDVAMLMAPQTVPVLAGMAGSCLQPREAQQPSMANLLEHLDVYFKKVAPKLPIVHLSSATLDGDQTDEYSGIGNPTGSSGASRTQVLQCAMAAVATQFMPGREARTRGDRMHHWASSEIKISLERSNIKVMQTIVLCEYYSRFRGRKAVVRPSREFEWVYRQLLGDPKNCNMLQSHPITTFADWIDLETRRRLLSACFLLDIHSSTLHSQETLTSRFLNVQPGHPLPIPLTGPTAQLWECVDEHTWKALLDSDVKLRHVAKAAPEVVPSVRSIDPSRAAKIGRLPFDGCLITVAEALSLRPRPNTSCEMDTLAWVPNFGGGNGNTEEKLSSCSSSISLSSSESQSILESDDEVEGDEGPVDVFGMARETEDMDQLAKQVDSHLLFPDNPTSLAYAALRVTPLLALLAVPGETYLFGHKITNARNFMAHKRKLRAWVSSRACEIAARWAAKALLGLLVEGNGGNMVEPWTQEISGYWTVYICVLILWAFGRREGPSSGNGTVDEATVFSWLKDVSEMNGNVQEKLRQRPSSDGLVSLARWKLEEEAAEGPNKIFADAITVLRKLDEKDDNLWF